MDEYAERIGVNNLRKTADGRKVLEEIRKKYARDIMQPSDKRFKETYKVELEQQAGVTGRKQEQANEKQERANWEREQSKSSHERRRLVL